MPRPPLLWCRLQPASFVVQAFSLHRWVGHSCPTFLFNMARSASPEVRWLEYSPLHRLPHKPLILDLRPTSTTIHRMSLAPKPDPPNTLYYRDNLDILSRYIDHEAIDLIYLDPPFNSNADYNVLFAERAGTQAHARIRAFEDTRTCPDCGEAGNDPDRAMN
jgi:hypothetical protein